MFEKVLLPETLEFVKQISKTDLPQNTYLGGGTAIALYLGHRRSADLDLFTQDKFIEDQWLQKFQEQWNFNLIQKDWQTLTGESKGIKISLFYYGYKLVNSNSNFYNLPLASLEDLAAMKIDTLMARGTKRDFIDIYFLAQKFGLAKILNLYEQKYGNFSEREVMIKKALIYFKDADQDEMPNMLVDISWDKVKKYFKNQVI